VIARSIGARKSFKCNGKKGQQGRGRGSLQCVKKTKLPWTCSRPSPRSASDNVFEVALKRFVTRSTASMCHVLYMIASGACLDVIEARFLVRLRTPFYGFTGSSSSLSIPSTFPPSAPMTSTSDNSSIFFEDDNVFRHGLSDPNVLANQKRAKIFDLLNRLHNTGWAY